MRKASYTLETLPPLTADRQEALTRLAAGSDEDIDTSDAPELSDETWATATRGGFYRPVKLQITARIDADVLAWLKSAGPGYQSRLNAILREKMVVSAKRRAPKPKVINPQVRRSHS